MPYPAQRKAKGAFPGGDPSAPGGGGGAPGLSASDPPGGPCSPASAASEDTEVTLPATLDGAPDEAHEEAELSDALGRQEDIRFASYRAAAKLRSLQRQTYLYHIDIWNMIEAFRERGLHGMDPNAKLPENKVRALLASLYGDLQKRLPPSTQHQTGGGTASAAGGADGAAAAAGHSGFLQAKENLLFNFLWRALRSSPASDRLRVRTLKAALATLCTGKLMDKLRYLFSQLSDEDGHLIRDRFTLFLRDVMKIPAALGEYRSFSGSEASESAAIFGQEGDPSSGLVTVNDFLETMMSDPGPQCLSWLLVLHRLINSESAFHPVTCGSCLAQGFHGLRYKSDRGSYHLCQNCFWRGRIAQEHAEDVFKEYNCFKSSSGKSSIKRSLHQSGGGATSEKHGGGGRGGGGSNVQSAPGSKNKLQQHFPSDDMHDRQNLANMGGGVLINGEMQQRDFVGDQDFGSRDMSSQPQPQDLEEHRLIAQYASQINQQEEDPYSRQQQGQGHHHSRRHHHHHHGGGGSGGGGHRHGRSSASPSGRRSISHSRQLVADLEKKNREIMRDINELRQQQGRRGGGGDGGGGSPKLLSELSHLRSRKSLLDDRLAELQDTRQELMTELEELMKLLHPQAATLPVSNKVATPDLTVTDPTGGHLTHYAYGRGGGPGGGIMPDYGGGGDPGVALYPPEHSLPPLSDE